MTDPVLDLELLRPGKMTVDLVGSSITPPRALSGSFAAIDLAGGGFWTIEYAMIALDTREEHLYWSRLRSRLSGSVRTISAPILTDWMAPTPVEGGPVYTTGILHSDGTTMSDDAGQRQSTMEAEVASAASLNAGTVSILVIRGAELIGGEVFSIAHSNRGDRAYSIEEIDSATEGEDGTTYVVGIRPPLREAITVGEVARFDRPRCRMILKPGTTFATVTEAPWRAEVSLQLVEAMGR